MFDIQAFHYCKHMKFHMRVMGSGLKVDADGSTHG